MPADAIGWVMQNPALVLTGVLALVALAWAADALEDAEDRREALGGFAQNAKSGTGGALNMVLVTVLSLVGWAATTFQTMAEAGQFVAGLAPHVPVLSASLVTIGLGAIGLSDLVVLRVSHFVVLSLGVLGLALAWRTDFGEVSLQ